MNGTWRYIVFAILLAYPDSTTEHPVYPAIKKLMKNIARNDEGSLTVFCMPWAFEDGMTWKKGLC